MIVERSSLEAAFARHLLPLARRWRQAADVALRELGLSDANGWVLVHISRSDAGIPQGMLAELIDISGASLVRRLDQLEAAGLIQREQAPDNRRSNYVRLTEKGAALTDHIEEAFAALRAALLTDVSDEDLTIADSVLARLDQRITHRRWLAR